MSGGASSDPEVTWGLPLYGSSGDILYADMNHGRSHYGRPLYSDLVTGNLKVTITIYFEYGKDLDILGFWPGSGGGSNVGWSYSGSNDPFTAADRSHVLYATWGGDNTGGGPETIVITGQVADKFFTDATYRIHFNWYRHHDDDDDSPSSQYNAHVVAVGGDGSTGEATVQAANNKLKRASKSDPHIDVKFGKRGHIISVSP